VAALLWAARESEGIARVAFDGTAAAEAEQDDLEDLLEDLEDPWMRFPSGEYRSK
jgi:hypothetical protein